MGWLYVPGLEDSSSECELRPAGTSVWCATSSGTPTLRPLSWHGWRTRPWIGRLSGTILRPSTAALGVVSWIASLRGCRANPIRLPVSETETSMSARSGRNSCASRCDRACLALLREAFALSLPTLRTSSDGAPFFWHLGLELAPPLLHTASSSAPPRAARLSCPCCPRQTAQYGTWLESWRRRRREGGARGLGLRRSETFYMTAPACATCNGEGSKMVPISARIEGPFELTGLIMSLPNPWQATIADQPGYRRRAVPCRDGALPRHRQPLSVESEDKLRRGRCLDDVVELLPTPTAMDSGRGGAAGYSDRQRQTPRTEPYRCDHEYRSAGSTWKTESPPVRRRTTVGSE